MTRLVFSGEKFAGRTFELCCDRVTVGRAPYNTLSIQDPSLSREHCEILTYGPEVIVRDLGSRNGTFIEGKPLNGGQGQLKHGQTIAFGEVEARLELEDFMSETCESTAFHDYRKYHKMPVEAAQSKPATLDAGYASTPVDQTMILPASKAPANAECPEMRVSASVTRPVPWRLLLIAGLVALLLITLLR